MGDVKAYFFNDMDAAANAHRTNVEEVRALSEELQGHMRRLASTWTSQSASPAQQQAHQAWQSVNQSVHEISQQRGVAVANARERMQATEQANANTFQV